MRKHKLSPMGEPHKIPPKPLLTALARKHGIRKLLVELANEFDSLALAHRYEGPREILQGGADILRGLSTALRGHVE